MVGGGGIKARPYVVNSPQPPVSDPESGPGTGQKQRAAAPLSIGLFGAMNDEMSLVARERDENAAFDFFFDILFHTSADRLSRSIDK